MKNPQFITLLLRSMGGGYLVYLSYQLLPETMVSTGVRHLIHWICMIVFFIVGGFLVSWSLKKIVKGEYIRSGQDDFLH